MSGVPSTDLAAEQQRPGAPNSVSSATHAGEDDLGFARAASEMPEAPKDKFFRKMKEQPLVPIGKCPPSLSFIFYQCVSDV